MEPYLKPKPLHQLKEERLDAIEKLDKIIAKAEAENSRAFTAEEKREVNEGFLKVQRIDLEIESGHPAWSAQKRQAEERQPGAGRESSFQSSPNTFWGKACKAIHNGEARSLTSSSASSIIQDPKVDSNTVLFDSLVANNPLEKLGMKIIKAMPNFTQFVRVSSLPTAYWIDKNTGTFTASDPTITNVKVDMKNLSCLIKVSNNLLRDQSPSTDAIIANVFQRVIQQALITKILTGDNTAGLEWDGIDNIAGVSSVAAGGVLGSYEKIVEAITTTMSHNHMVENIGGLASIDVCTQLNNMLDNDNNPMQPPKLFNQLKGFHYSTAVGETYDTDKTRIFIADWSKSMLAVEGSYELRADQTYATEDATGFFLLYRSSFHLIEPDAFTILTGITTV